MKMIKLKQRRRRSSDSKKKMDGQFQVSEQSRCAHDLEEEAFRRRAHLAVSRMSEDVSDDGMEIFDHHARRVEIIGSTHDSPSMYSVRWLSILLFVLGSAAAGTILGFGIQNARQEEEHEFRTVADAFVHEFDAMWDEYQLAGLWLHQANRGALGGSGVAAGDPNEVFRDVYGYLQSTGLHFFAVASCPNVTDSEREAVEQRTKQFYAENYPQVPYNGFTQLSESGLSLEPRSKQPFYFPCTAVEPVSQQNLPFLGMDIYSFQHAKDAIDESLCDWKASLSGMLPIAEPIVLLVHPGVPLEHLPDLRPQNVSLVALPVKGIIDYLAGHRQNGPTVNVYMFDSSASREDSTIIPQYLGGGRIQERDGAHSLSHKNGKTRTLRGSDPSVLASRGLTPTSDSSEHYAGLTKWIPARSWSEASGQDTDKFSYHRKVEIASREWTLIITGDKSDYPADIAFVILASVMIFVASLCMAWTVYNSYSRFLSVDRIRRRAEAEKHDIFLRNARDATLHEREMNDYISHEVRNPLCAAMSAASFVASAVNAAHPLATEEERAAVREDVEVIDTSLQFINDLLRNMLDMHRASSNRLKLVEEPTDILKDILQPVAGMLYRRGKDFEVLVDCPENMFINADKLRLKQIVLNLARNAVKFVERGFVRLKAKNDVEDGVTIYVEDSGPGIPEEKRNALFSKFQESLDALNQGTGIGLSLCDHLVGLMGGNIGLDDDYHSGIEGCPGTRFIINLKTPSLPMPTIEQYEALILSTSPLKTSSDGDISGYTKEESDESEDADSQGISSPRELPDELNVLFVDDDTLLRKLFTRSLKRVAPGWKVDEAANGETAIRMAADDENYDLIFMDQYMASVDKQLLGTETTRALRSRGVQARICGLSANDMEKVFLRAGANAFMMKPFPCGEEPLRQELLRVLFQDPIVVSTSQPELPEE